MTKDAFGKLPDGQEVSRITIAGHGLTASVVTLGASLQDLRLDGVAHPLVLGFPTLPPYLDEGRYFGAIVGRCANRIARGEAEIDGRPLALDRNEAGRTTLHGGSDGTGVRNWTVADHGPDFVALSDYLPDGHMGFPGAMLVRVRYQILPGPALRIEIVATSSETTICNFAQHSYFNLDGKADISDHRLTIPAETYLPVDEALIPLGSPAPVAGTHLDFRQPVRLAERLGGPLIDHNLCIDTTRHHLPRPAAVLQAGDVRMTIDSTEPGLQVYAAAHMQGGAKGIGGAPYGRHAGIAMESQLWPDAVHHWDYPSTLLTSDQVYRQTTVLGFTRTGSS
ncbi:aldose epimerase family protein [Paracoccus sp. KR1-242]|uniref:aldose epimerase family protein n=1 Tax=Paracoccus sp. KR1-242 TaxID=3410028 RepID=UPI003C07F7BB